MIKIDIDPIKKTFKVTVSGMVTANEAREYLNNYEQSIKKIDPKQYTMIMDAREQKTVTQDVISLLEEAIKMYADTPFAKKYAIIIDSAVAMLQVKRVGKDDLSQQFEFVKSLDEAL